MVIVNFNFFFGGQLVEYLKMKPDGLVTVLREPCINQNNAPAGMDFKMYFCLPITYLNDLFLRQYMPLLKYVFFFPIFPAVVSSGPVSRTQNNHL